jgi:hypothetical protein
MKPFGYWHRTMVLFRHFYCAEISLSSPRAGAFPAFPGSFIPDPLLRSGDQNAETGGGGEGAGEKSKKP